MAEICASSILACGMRVTLLDLTGNVATGPNNYYSTDKLVEVQVTPDVELGDDRTVKSGCDCIIVTAKFPDLLKRFNFQIQLGQQEQDLISLLLGATRITSGGVGIGWDWPVNLQCGQTPPPPVALEFWSYVWDVDHQDPNLPYWHWIFPRTHWQVGQFTVNNDALVMPFTGFSIFNSVWNHGPYGDTVPVGGLGAVYQTATAPPAAVCGLQTVTPGS